MGGGLVFLQGFTPANVTIWIDVFGYVWALVVAVWASSGPASHQGDTCTPHYTNAYTPTHTQTYTHEHALKCYIRNIDT